MTLAVCFQNFLRFLLLDTNFSILLNTSRLQSVLKMKIAWESSTGFPLTRPYCCSHSSLSISRASTGFLPCHTRKMEMSPVLTFKLDEVGEATVRNSVWLPYRFFSTCCHRAAKTISFWNLSWKPIVFTILHGKRELFGLILSWEWPLVLQAT